MKTTVSTPIQPWYKQFWPWLIIALPASAVLAGFITLYLAITTPDSLVRDDWYKEGLSINRRMQLDQNTLALGLSGTLTVDALTSEILLNMQSTQPSYIHPAQLYLEFSHPTLASHDQRILLKHNQAGHYRGLLAQTLNGKYQLSLSNQASLPDTRESPVNNSAFWRIIQIEIFPLKNPIHLGE